MNAPPLNIDLLMDEIVGITNHIDDLTNEISSAKSRKKALLKDLQVLMEQNGVKSCANTAGRANTTQKEFISVTDWEAFYNFIHENRFYHLLQRRVSNTAALELYDHAQTVPGTERIVVDEVRVTRKK